MPTPIKYFNSSIHGEYEKLEDLAVGKLSATLPEELKMEISPYLAADKNCAEYKFMKAADKLSAYLKCLEEIRSGNNEFMKAEKTIKEALFALKMRSVDYFMEHFVPAFYLTLDELEGL